MTTCPETLNVPIRALLVGFGCTVKVTLPLPAPLAVEVITETSLGLKVAVPAGVLLPSGQWKPSPKLIVLSSLLPLFPGQHTPVQFRVTSVGLGTWSVDDFYIDPRCH